MQPSRRAFLLGRRPAQTPWARFMQRLTLLCQGPCATWARRGRPARLAGARARGRPGPRPGAVRRVRRGPGAGRRGGNRRWSLPAGGSREPQRPGPPGRRHAALAGPARRAAGGAGASRPAAVRRPARRHDAGRMAGGASRLAGGTLRAVRSWRPTWCWPTGWRKPWGLLARATNGRCARPRCSGWCRRCSTEHGAGRRRLRRGRRLGRSLPAGRAAATGARHGQPGASAAGARRHAGLGAGGAAHTCRRPGREAARRRRWTVRREAGRRLDARIKALFDPDGRFPYSLSQ